MNVQQIMYELNNIRKKRNVVVSVMVALGIITIGAFFTYCATIDDLSDLDTMVSMIIIICSVVLAVGLKSIGDLDKQSKALYKSTLVPLIMSNRLGYVEYYSQCGFPIQSVQAAGLISNMGNFFYSEDYMRGSYAGVNYRQSDVNFKYVTNKNKEIQLFYGRVFEFDYIGKNVPELVICTRGYSHYPTVYNFYPVKLESEDFNLRFKVFTSAPHDAFYMLTPQMMEKLIMLSDRYDSFALRFTNNRLYVAIQRLDSFEINLNKKLDYNAMMMSFDSDVQTIIDLIYVLNCLPKNM